MAKKKTAKKKVAPKALRPLLKTVRIKIADLQFDPENANKHNDENIRAIEKSLTRFKQMTPIVVDSKNVVRKGNGTMQAAINLGWDALDCLVTDLSDEELTAYGIVDNRSAELAEWDWGVLKELYDGLDEDLADATGFGEGQIDELIAKLDQGDDNPLAAEDDESGDGIGGQVDYNPVYQVMIDCKNEAEQRKTYEELTKQGYTVKCQQV